jgi:hypothetical protein
LIPWDIRHPGRNFTLDIATGADKHAPVIIQVSVRGTGDGNDGNGNVPFNGRRQMNRPGLCLLNAGGPRKGVRSL